MGQPRRGLFGGHQLYSAAAMGYVVGATKQSLSAAVVDRPRGRAGQGGGLERSSSRPFAPEQLARAAVKSSGAEQGQQAPLQWLEVPDSRARRKRVRRCLRVWGAGIHVSLRAIAS